MKKIIVSICCALMLVASTACGTASKAPNLPADVKEPEKTEFALGETWTVDGQWSLTVLGATETTDRNQFSDKNPAAVYIIDYVYTNEGFDDGIMDGLYISLENTIVDAAGVMGYSYPGNITNYAQSTPVGATCFAQACIGVDNPGTFTTTVSTYDSNSTSRKATFIVDPSLPHAEFQGTAGASSNASALHVGETWTVDGQWTLTINGAYATDARNEFSDKYPAAVYVVDYTYQNLGYEDDYSDGLYLSIDETIVDAAGQMGYSYPGDITNYPQQAPVGATCNAQACIGVSNAGPFTITVSLYDSNNNRQSQTFLVEP